MRLLLTLMCVQALLGGFDNLWHHEITEQLPSKRSAAPELALHAAREFLYAFLFFALAWYEWHGYWAVLVGAVFVAEILITLADFIVEDQTRHLPKLERILHTLLAMTVGAVLIVLAPILRTWNAEPAAIYPVTHGMLSWCFTVVSIGVLAWSVRNALAVLRHRRPLEWVRDPLQSRAPSGRTLLVTGATGFIGGHLVRRLVAHGDAVLVLTRNPERALDRFGPHVRIITDLKALPGGTAIDAIVNLAGERILAFPWTSRRRRALLDSRIKTTRALVDLCARLEQSPRVLVSASAVGFYGVRGDEALDERASPQPIFQSELCQDWEGTAQAASSLGTRVVLLRFGLVLSGEGGALPSLAQPVRMGVGALLGTGRQWMSWIHIEDALRLIEFALRTSTLRGPVNAVAPAAVTHAEFQRELARTLRRPLWLRVPGFLLRRGLGEMAQLLLDGQRVVPARALTAGFDFQYPHLAPALRHLLDCSTLKPVAPKQFIYYNGACPVCRTEMNHYARRCAAVAAPVTFIDSSIRGNDLAEYGLRWEHLERRIYLKSANGRILSGVAALISLWSQTPGYRWLSRVVGTSVVRPVANVLYDHIIVPLLTSAMWRSRRAIARGRILGS